MVKERRKIVINDKETFGVELELITSKFNQKMESIKNKTKSFGKSIKENFTTGMYLDTSDTKNRIQELKNELKKLTTTNYVWISKGDELIYVKDRIKEVKAELKVLKSDLNTIETSKVAKVGSLFGSLKTKIEKVKNSFSSIKQKTTEFDKSFKKALNTGISKAKRFTLSLFGIQSIWRALSRASSSYLSEDIELSNKLQAVWTGLGAILSPLLNNIANFFLKLIGYINVFVKAVTGVDYLANAMDKTNKNTKKTSASVNKLKGQLSGIDEINNISEPKDSSTPDLKWTDAFENLELDTSWVDAITNFGIWFKDNWPIVLSLLAGTFTALELIKLGISGIKALGIGIAIAGIVYTITSLIQYINDPSWKNFGNVLKGIGIVILGVGIAIGSLPVAVAGAIVLILGIIASFWDEIKAWFDNVLKFFYDGGDNLMNFIQDKLGVFGSLINVVIGTVVGVITSAIEMVKHLLDGLFTGVKQILDGIIMIFKGDFKNGIITILKGLGNMIVGLVNTLISGLNLVLAPIRALVVAIGKVTGQDWTMENIKIPTIPKLDTGTNYVPNDQLAFIHKGEAVIPKKFNNEEYFNNGNDETNALLRELIETIEDKNMDIYIDKDKIGKIQENYSSNRSRIMGRGYA